MNRPPSRPRRSIAQGLRLVSCLFPFIVGSAAAAPFKPERPGQVLERLPERIGASEEAGMATLRARLRAKPDDAQAAAELAERHYRIAQRRGDPRHIGYAQALIAPWKDAANPSQDIRLVRALIAQFLHEFPAARRELGLVLAGDPANLAALSYRAVLAMVSADYPAAARDCDLLTRHGTGLVVEACRPTVDALTGKAASAYRALRESLTRHPAAPDNERLWVLSRLAEIALRLDQPAKAEEYFRAGLALGLTDQLLLATYAEFLMDAGRPREAVSLLKAHTENDVLLLRLALAERMAGAPDAPSHAALLAARIEANRRRGDKTHLADEASYELVFGKNPQRAVALAAENWHLEQREPSDARILLETSMAAGKPDAATPVLRWMTETGIEDARLKRLAALLGSPVAKHGPSK
jgi:hypothetical protein